MSRQQAIKAYKLQYSEKTDEELVAIQIETRDSTDPVIHIAVTQLLYERGLAHQAKQIAEIKRVHWSITPSFMVGIIAMVASCIAAYASLFPVQAQSLASSIVQLLSGEQTVHTQSSNLQPPLPSSQPEQKPSSRN